MMNPGPVEEAGQTARSFIEVMKDQPAMLIMSIANFALIIFIFYGLKAAGDFRERLTTQNYEYQKLVTEVLARCGMPKTLYEEPPHT